MPGKNMERSVPSLLLGAGMCYEEVLEGYDSMTPQLICIVLSPQLLIKMEVITIRCYHKVNDRNKHASLILQIIFIPKTDAKYTPSPGSIGCMINEW